MKDFNLHAKFRFKIVLLVFIGVRIQANAHDVVDSQVRRSATRIPVIAATKFWCLAWFDSPSSQLSVNFSFKFLCLIPVSVHNKLVSSLDIIIRLMFRHCSNTVNYMVHSHLQNAHFQPNLRWIERSGPWRSASFEFLQNQCVDLRVIFLAATQTAWLRFEVQLCSARQERTSFDVKTLSSMSAVLCCAREKSCSVQTPKSLFLKGF